MALPGVSRQLRAQGRGHGQCLCASHSLGNAEKSEGSALRSLGLRGSCKHGKSHPGWGWWDTGAGPWEKGMYPVGKSCWQ